MSDPKAISPEARLKRFLYLNSERARFVSGDPEAHGNYDPKNITFNSDLDASALLRVPVMFESLSSEDVASKRAALVALVALLRPPQTAESGPSDKHELYSTALNLFDCNEDLFFFVKCFRSVVKNVPSGLKKIVASYYFRQEPMELVRTVTEGRSYHGWTHKDLFKLAHYKTDSLAIDLIMKYVLFGFEQALSSSTNTKEEIEILDYIKKFHEYKSTSDEKRAIELMNDLPISRVEQLPQKLTTNYAVWEALIGKLSLADLISILPKLYKLGFLKQGGIHEKIVETLTDKNKIGQSKIQPIEVFIGLKNLEKGGKPKDPNLVKYLESKEACGGPEPKRRADYAPRAEPARCAPAVAAALQRALHAAYANLRPSAARLMVTVEVKRKEADRMAEPCLTTRNASRIEAAALVVACLVRSNRNHVLAAFNGSGLAVVQLDENASIGHIIKKLKEWHHDQVHWNAPFDWAKKNKKQFDLFVNIATTSECNFSQETKNRTKTAFQNYCKEMNLNETKLVTYAPAVHNLSFADGSRPYLDVCGFDRNTLKVIEAFGKNLF